MMERVSFFKKLYYSFTKFDKYPRMIKEGTGRAFIYLLLFSLIFGSISGIITATKLNNGINTFISKVETELPDFTLSNGVLHVEGKMPIILNEENEDLFIIDTSGVTTPDILVNEPAGILVLKDEVIVKQNAFQIQTYRFSDIGLDLNKDVVLQWLPILKWLGVIVGALVLIFFMIGKLFSALILSLIGLIISAVRSLRLTFGNLYSIAIYSLTLPVILHILLAIFDINLRWYLYYGIAIIIAILAINNIKKAEHNVKTEAEEIN